jgi:tRNA(fMet)-specific endonuclease VapC
VIILDTDVLSIVQRGEGPAYDHLVARLDVADDEVVVCIVSFEEQMRGWLAYIAGSNDRQKRHTVGAAAASLGGNGAAG